MTIKIGTKLLGGLLGVSLIALLVGIFGYLQLRNLSSNDLLLYQKATVPLKEIGGMGMRFHRMRVNLRDLAAADNPANVELFTKRINELRGELDQLSKNLETHLPDAES